MVRKCLITKRMTMFGNLVSKSNRKTKRCFYLNLQKHVFYTKSSRIHLKISCRGLRTIKKIGLKNTLLSLKLKKRFIYESKKKNDNCKITSK